MPHDAPDPFRDTFVAMTAARAIIAATRLGVVAALAEEPATARVLSARLSLDLAGCEALLAALDALGYVRRGPGGSYAPSAAGLRLVPGSEDTMAHFVGAYSAHAWEMLGELERVLADPSGARSHHRPAGDDFWDSYIRGLFELGRAEHDLNAAMVPAQDPRTLLDVAGGHGGFAMAMCRRFPGLSATVLDLPASAAVGRRVVAEQGFSERVAFREGDALVDPLGEELDVISMFNLLHHLPAQGVRDLLSAARRALRAGGWIVIGETRRADPEEPQSVDGAMSGLVYFASSGTRNYSPKELTEWLERAGFADVSVRSGEGAAHRLVYLARAP